MVKDGIVKGDFYLRGTGKMQDKFWTLHIKKMYIICVKGVLHLCLCVCVYQPEAICMYPARVQILLSHPPLGRKMVMMANRELTASRAQPPEQSTALV